MTQEPTNERLERLISRFLDDEATSLERRELNSAMSREPVARALYEETAALDREIGRAMRSAVRRNLALRPLAAQRFRPASLIGIAAAAALAAIVILRDPVRPDGAGRGGPAVQYGGNWGFVAPPQPGDTFDSSASPYALPHVQLRDSQRDWFVVPGEGPDQFLIIEVDHVQLRAVGIHGDY